MEQFLLGKGPLCRLVELAGVPERPQLAREIRTTFCIWGRLVERSFSAQAL